jgi:uncharacterized protein (TIGR02145 family)
MERLTDIKFRKGAKLYIGSADNSELQISYQDDVTSFLHNNSIAFSISDFLIDINNDINVQGDASIENDLFVNGYSTFRDKTNWEKNSSILAIQQLGASDDNYYLILGGSGGGTGSGTGGGDTSVDYIIKKGTSEKFKVTDNYIKISNGLWIAGTTVEESGMIRFNGTNFQGYKSGSWTNLDTQGEITTASNGITKDTLDFQLDLDSLTTEAHDPDADELVFIDGTDGSEKKVAIDLIQYWEPAKTNQIWLGKIYNWHAVNTGNLAPTGYRVPSTTDWTTLFVTIGGIGNSGQLKSTNVKYWDAPNSGAQNLYNMNIHGAFRYVDGSFIFAGQSTYTQVCLYATTTPYSGPSVFYVYFRYDNIAYINYDSKQMGTSVRCMRDLTLDEINAGHPDGYLLESILDEDGNSYDAIVIGTQAWLNRNLATTTYNNGNAIANIIDDTDWSNDTSGVYCDFDNDSSYTYELADSTTKISPRNDKIIKQKAAIFISEYDNGNSGIADTIDWNTAQNQKITLTANTTLSFIDISDASCTARLQLKIIQDLTGNWSVTFPANVIFPTLFDFAIGEASQECIVTLYYDGTNYIALSTQYYNLPS